MREEDESGGVKLFRAMKKTSMGAVLGAPRNGGLRAGFEGLPTLGARFEVRFLFFLKESARDYAISLNKEVIKYNPVDKRRKKMYRSNLLR